MKIARIVFPVTVLGPGNRCALWLSGCGKRCAGCGNPELQDGDYGRDMPPGEIMRIISEMAGKESIDGFTISGGEPFLQSEELLELVRSMREYSEDILIYTGMLRKELTGETERCIIKNTAVLIDGEYKEELNCGEMLRGSSNQCVYYKNDEIRKRYEEYVSEYGGRAVVQTVPTGKGIVLMGINGGRLKEEVMPRIEKKLVSGGTGSDEK